MRFPWTSKTAVEEASEGEVQTPDAISASMALEQARGADPWELSIQHAEGHVVVTKDGTWAFFALAAVDGQFRSLPQRLRMFEDLARSTADLVGHRIWVRGTSSPVEAGEWAARLDRDHPHPDTPLDRGHPPVTVRRRDRDGTRSFEEMMRAAQFQMLDLDAATPGTVIGVRVTTDRIKEGDLSYLMTDRVIPDGLGGYEEHRRTLQKITRVVEGVGFGGSVLSPALFGWLVHASAGMGAPTPSWGLVSAGRGGWAGHEVPGFTNGVRVDSPPRAPYVRVHAIRDCRETTSFVTVLHAREFRDRDDEDLSLVPFLSWVHGLNVDRPAQWVACFDVVDGHTLKGAAQYNRRVARDMKREHEHYDDDAPKKVEAGIERAIEIEDELSSADPLVSTRLVGVVLIAVTGDSVEAVTKAAENVASAANKEQSVTLFRDFDQFHLYRSFIPGEPVRMTGHVTQMGVGFFGSFLPAATTAAGDSTGILVGPIAGGREIMRHDLFGGARRDGSNLVVALSNSGIGKSSWIGCQMDWASTLGIRTVGYDPGGTWGKLTELPWQRGDSRHVDLSAGNPGILVPSTLIVDPSREDYDSTPKWQAAKEAAAVERGELMIDTFSDLLLLGSGSETARTMGSLLEQAVQDAGGGYGVDPWQVVANLRESKNELGKVMADRLTTKATTVREGRLVFPPRTSLGSADVDDSFAERTMNSSGLTIISMGDLLDANDDDPRRTAAARPILRLGGRFAIRTMYADRRPKFICMDELSVSGKGGGASFRPFMVRAATDSRKRYANVTLVGQTPSMYTDLGPEVSTLIGAAWVGRLDAKVAPAALPILGLPEGHGYEEVIAGLPQGHFVHRDWRHRIRKVEVTRGWWHPALLEALDTTAGGEGSYDDTYGSVDLFERMGV